jgi:hypothetical protein
MWTLSNQVIESDEHYAMDPLAVSSLGVWSTLAVATCSLSPRSLLPNPSTMVGHRAMNWHRAKSPDP